MCVNTSTPLNAYSKSKHQHSKGVYHMTTIITTISDLLEKYHVTLAQLRKAERQVDTETHTVYYLVESQTTEGVRYEVRYNHEYHCLQCLPHLDGPSCLASVAGIPCWHKRAALCREAEYAILKLAAQ